MPEVEGRSTALEIEGENTEILEAPADLSTLPELMAAKHWKRGTKICGFS